MKYKRGVLRQELVVYKITCDLCGSDILVETMQDAAGEPVVAHMGIEIQADWGYFSNNKDGDHYEIDVCEKCFDKIFGKVKPISNYITCEQYDKAEEEE